MAAAGDPVGAMRARLERRFRWFTVYHGILVAIAVIAIGWIALTSGDSQLFWAFVFIAIVMPAGVPLVWWLNHRGVEQLARGLEPLRRRVRDAKVSAGVGYLLVLDNGVVLVLDPRTNSVRFVGFFSAGGTLLQPDAAQAARWAMRIRGMRNEGMITKNKGPPEAQAELERFRVALGAKFYVLSVRDVKPDRLSQGEPMRHMVLGFFLPKWRDHAEPIAHELDRIAAFLQENQGRTFSPAGS